MAKKDKLIKSKSIYTIKKQHTVTNNGIIYENDHVTIVPNDGLYDDEMALFSESNFKYKIDTTQSSKKRHNRGEFIKPEGGSGEAWTLNTLSAATVPTEESTIVLKPNYSSLKDFAYYGSAVELIRATVNDIVLRFPGGISYYGEGKAPLVISGSTSYYLVSNEFDIDCWTGGGLISSGTVKNPMRVLAASFMNYVDSNGKDISAPSPNITGNCPNSIIGTVNVGGKDLEIFMDGEGKKYLVTSGNSGGGVIIKPKQSFIDEFWSTMDDFERVLLNRDTTPVYKAVFETPYFDETGYYYENKSYVWPTIDGFTPDITTGAFQGYLESLISLATFHDEFDSDNIWRMMTHESIKNLDWTYNTRKGDDETDLTDFDTKGIGAIMRIYGRQFDDIKRYADNIKNSNTLSYDEKSNAPDYFLSDTIENDGWEAQHSAPFTDNANVVSATVKSLGLTLYTSGKTSGFVNASFQRRLALSSNYIQSMKGTRRGIETILGMFGYQPDSATTATTTAGYFNINEYVALANSGLSYDDGCEIRSYGDNPYEDDDLPHLMYGYPVAVIEPGDKNIPRYMVPWFDKSIGGKTFYFQSKGGWGKRASKLINLPKLTNLTELSGITIYGETQPYMRFAKNIDEMLGQNKSDLYEGIICYVTDISTIERDYTLGSGENLDDCSHYFSLVNVALSTHCGFLQNDIYNCYGWKQITNTEISEMTTVEGKKVVYLESLTTDYKGNNPHIGYGKYDDGSEYIEHFTHLFKKTFEMGLYDRWKEEAPSVYESAATFGFKVCEVLDNKKCAFFEDLTPNTDFLILGAEGNEGEDASSKTETAYNSGLQPYGENKETILNWNSENYKTVKFPDTPENVDKKPADESQANGIINIKKLVINFGTGGNVHLKNYIQNVVLKYLEQMVPSTAILEYRFDNKSANETSGGNFNNGTFSFIRTAHAAIVNNSGDSTITVWREYPTPINEM